MGAGGWNYLYSLFTFNKLKQQQSRSRVGVWKYMKTTIKLQEVRAAIGAKKGTISQIIKGMYAFDDCKELKSLLPAKKDLLNITAIICKEMGIGEKYVINYKDGRSVGRMRKPSFDLVLRYLVKHQADIDQIIADNKAKKAVANDRLAA